MEPGLRPRPHRPRRWLCPCETAGLHQPAAGPEPQSHGSGYKDLLLIIKKPTELNQTFGVFVPVLAPLAKEARPAGRWAWGDAGPKPWCSATPGSRSEPTAGPATCQGATGAFCAAARGAEEALAVAEASLA